MLIARGEALDADVFIVPHHGSGSSSTSAFMNAVSPQHGVFTVGYRNRFGHPEGEAWKRYSDVARHRTDRDGAITFRFASSVIGMERERETRRCCSQGR